MATIIKVSLFTLVIVVLIAGFASVIPQLESPAPEVLNISGSVSGPELAALGETVFESPEGGCTACHAVGREGLRGPDLAGIGAQAGTIVPGKSAEDYIRESIVDPCAHITEGYDCLMPQTLLQTLGTAKVTALIAYMQSLGGEITVELTGEEAAAEPDNPGVGVKGTTAEEVLVNAGCAACHTVEASGAAGLIGPDLSTIGAVMPPDEIRQSILDPDAVLAEECPAKDENGNPVSGPCQAGVMPKDYGQKLSAGQLETLVLYLSELK